MKPAGGNGSGKLDIGAHDMGGFVRVVTGPLLHAYPPDLGLFLAHRLAQWFRERPHLRLRCVVPIQRDGYTVELHGWYEQTLFPDSSPLAAQKPARGGPDDAEAGR
jgi:hypothetical protein